jgi:hypothetical protein
MKKVAVVVGVVLAGLVSLCLMCSVVGWVAGQPASNGELDGRYDCMIAATVMMNGMITPQYQPAGISFTIDGDTYSTTGGDGSVRFDADVVSFIGGGMDGWHAGRGTDTLIIHKNPTDPQPSASVQNGDFRCARR